MKKLILLMSVLFFGCDNSFKIKVPPGDIVNPEPPSSSSFNFAAYRAKWMKNARSNHTATLLSDGKVLVTGGGYSFKQ